jgi:ribosomal-protein-alanine N-acetyltransferase
VSQACAIHIAPLSLRDVPELEPLENATSLCYWGTEHYKNFLTQPEYFGRKAMLTPAQGEGRLVGFYFARAVLENLELLKIGVYPEFQKMGIGTQLLDASFVEGRRRGCLRCFLEVRKSNENAIQFYYRHGFKLAGQRINYYTSPLEDALVMERWL